MDVAVHFTWYLQSSSSPSALNSVAPYSTPPPPPSAAPPSGAPASPGWHDAALTACEIPPSAAQCASCAPETGPPEGPASPPAPLDDVEQAATSPQMKRRGQHTRAVPRRRAPINP